MNTNDSPATSVADPAAPPLPRTPLSTGKRWLVAGASFGAFWLSATPIALLLYLAEANDVNALVICLAASLAGTMFSFTAGLILYLILKT